MKKASEYRQHSEECRAMARSIAAGEQRDQLLTMAETWARLALERAELIRKHPELALEGETQEETVQRPG